MFFNITLVSHFNLNIIANDIDYSSSLGNKLDIFGTRCVDCISSSKKKRKKTCGTSCMLLSGNDE